MTIIKYPEGKAMEYKIILPFAPILVESTRSIGYSFESALADIIDNSVSKGAKKIFVNYDSMEPQYAAVIDDGCGMDPSELELAMRYGSKSSLETRDQDDLGRFGLGLKMASLSQCRKLTVATKKNGIICAAQWNLDLITERKDWVLLWYNENDIDKIRFIGELRSRDSGTIVIWEDFDRTTKGSADKAKTFDEKIEIARNHISLVFHRFIGDENPSQRINIYFNKDRVEPVDPFLLNNAATQPLVEQTFVVEGSEIKVKPYVLPYVSKLSSKDKKQLGDINDLRQNQGFYVYRNKRLIIWGTCFVSLSSMN